uniref:G-type lectin S-receptor-like serine/threonine-protein kinase At4g27290 n=1 Tax=Erigeron canadensis TaxID=72917 RepID=UPI001CB99524|nr:G-type lectin S-receptor-like serine/threonine-protein kinase At4g27290 [Erigeron canadensis]
MNMLLLIATVTFFFLSRGTPSALDTIFLNQNITDGETKVSRHEKFELGFFSPGSSKNRYLGIWFKNTSPRTPVWVANRKFPLVNALGMVKLDSHGILSLVNDGGTVIWSSDASASSTNVSPKARLMDTGNLVIEVKNSVIWQSFDYPGDTYIPGMKLGKDLVTGREMYLTSWKSSDDPALGEYTIRLLMVKDKYPQIYIRKGSVIETRIGPYDGIEFAGHPNSRHDSNHMYNTGMVFNEKEIYYTRSSNSSTFLLSRSVMSLSGK